MKNNTKLFIIVLVLLIANASTLVFAKGKKEENSKKANIQSAFALEGVDSAVFAGGCFWGVEAVFEKLQGVASVESGYSGGTAETAFYRMVGSGKTDHAESVQVLYDPEQISYEKLLEIFFMVAHDPTQLNYQGPDRGREYRSAIFYMNDEQKTKAQKYIKDLSLESVYPRKIVTLLEPLEQFYRAEDYHQDFMRLNPEHPYIVYWDVPKVKDLEEKYPQLISK